MTTHPDYYAVLGIPRDAEPREIARAYRALMRSHHPDMGPQRAPYPDPVPKPDPGSGPGREGGLLRIMQAFYVLRDPRRRAAYDRQLAAAARQDTAGPRDVPVRRVRGPAGTGLRGPVIRVGPVRWERGPWSP